MVNVRLMESWKVSKFVFKLCNLWLSCFLWSSVPSCWAELLGVCWGFKGMPLPLFSILIWLVIILSFPHKKGRKKKLGNCSQYCLLLHAVLDAIRKIYSSTVPTKN